VPGVIKYFGHQLIFGNVRNWILGSFKLVQFNMFCCFPCNYICIP
jgi:hypothetical protein